MLFVDRAVGSADLYAPLCKLGLPAQLADIGTADIEFVGRGVKDEPVLIGVELKRISELTSDWDRLVGHQVPKMTHFYTHRWLVYEGEWSQGKDGALQRREWSGRAVKASRRHYGLADASALRKKLLTLEMCAGLHVQHTLNRHDTAHYLMNLYRWWTDDAQDEHRSHIVVYQPHGLIPMSLAEQAIAMWPGLSIKRCKAVARHFNSDLSRACAATVKEWAGIEIPDDEGNPRKLGMKVAQKLVRFLHGDGT